MCKQSMLRSCVLKTALISHWLYWSGKEVSTTFINVNFYSSVSSNTTYCSELRRRGDTVVSSSGHRALIHLSGTALQFKRG